MKYLYIIGFVFCGMLANSCTTERVLFEKGDWWLGHWQKIADDSQFFSSGQKRVSGIVTPQFFYSTPDSIKSNFHMKTLKDFNHKKRWKLIETNENTFIKILEIDESNIEVFGPSTTIAGLEEKIEEFKRIPDQVEPPFPDSILFDE